MAAFTFTTPAHITAETSVSGASVTFGKTISENKAQAIISSTPTDDNYALLEEKEGIECVVSQV